MTNEEKTFYVGDLVFYRGPPLVTPLRWDRIVANNNGIVSDTDLGVIVICNNFLRVADVYFQIGELLVKRISFTHLLHAIE